MYLKERYERYKEERTAEIQQDLDDGYITMEQALELKNNIMPYDDFVEQYNERMRDWWNKIILWI